MPKAKAKPDTAVDPDKLKREGAGRYATADGRFTVEQSSGGWMTVDAETTDELGLSLVRGPFPTLDEARAAIAEARTGPKATSALAQKLAAAPKARPRTDRPAAGAGAKPRPQRKAREPEIAIRDMDAADGDALRVLWKAAGFRSVGDDDRSLAAFAQRNPGLLLVATADGAVIASALGAWDGRRGWIYHVATAEPFRRKGIATRLVKRLEQRLRIAGAPRVNAVVRDERPDARKFWEALGFVVAPSHLFGKDV